jgi:hypothetical protein
MCAVSNIGDQYRQILQPQIGGTGFGQNPTLPASSSEVAALRADVLEMKAMLLAAQEYDRKTKQPDCQQEEKLALLRKIAELVGVDLSMIGAETKK